MSRDSHSDAASEKTHPPVSPTPVSRTGSPRRSRVIFASATIGLMAILALALGLGLGLGLKHHHHHDSTAATASSLPPLQTSSADNFALGKVQGQAPQTRSYNFTISQVNGAPDGVSKPMLVVNGIFPGPTIEANQGDRIIVNVTNNIDNATTIHWHGLFQHQTNFYDGTAGITECGIPPGQFLVYNFTFGSFSGTTWYHAHATQYTDGITGALIVHPSDPAPQGFPTWDQELVIQMNDLYHTFSAILLDEYLSIDGIDGTPGDEPVPDAGTLNGLGQWNNWGDYFNFTLEQNKTYRLRLVNTGSFTSIRFSLDYHPLTIIEVDGTLVEPYTVAGLVIAVAQRYSVLIHTNQTEGDGRYWMRTTLQTDMFTYDQPGQNVDIRGIIKYSNSNDTGLPTATDDPGVPGQGLNDMDTSLFVPAVVDAPPNSTSPYHLTISLENTSDNHFLAFMNSTSWVPLSGTTTLLNVRNAFAGGSSYAPSGGSIQPGDQFMITEDSIQVVDLLIDNLDDGDHPFHLHGHRPWIMGTGAGRYGIGEVLNSTNPLRRDTILIPAYNWMALRFITDNPGLWAFHCHLAWHMAAGLLMQINSLPSTAAQLNIPQTIIDQCKS